MNLLKNFHFSFNNFSENRAFCIDEKNISYRNFLEYINGSRILLESGTSFPGCSVGVVCYDCIETYAAIFAIWFSGNHFVPINPKYPLQRNMEVIEKTGVKMVFSVKNNISEIIDTKHIKLLNNFEIKSETDNSPKKISDEQLMYILTTSGSTGHPKQVPINHSNVKTYCNGFLKLFPELKSNACFLQTYDLTSDASFTGYLLPLLVGACVYTVPHNSFKFLSIAKLISNKEITWVKLTPSVLNYLKPYITKLNLKHIKHLIFGGEALPLSMIKLWQPIFKEADISNLYGPTETTISATTYRFNTIKNIKSRNGIISIGKPFPEVEYLIINDSKIVTESGAKGELCIGGKQTMSRYLNSDFDSFFKIKQRGETKKYYRTGDLVQKDNEGYLYFLGRLDDQVKIDGYRVNLIEVENIINSFLKGEKAVVLSQQINGLFWIVAFIETQVKEFPGLLKLLNKKLPPQMIPGKIIPISKFPITTSGKINKEKLRIYYLCDE